MMKFFERFNPIYWRNKFQEVRGENHDLKQENFVLKDRIRQAEVMKQCLDQQVSELERDLYSAKQSADKVTELLGEKMQVIDQLHSRITALQGSLDETKYNVDGYQEQLACVEIDLQNKEKEVEELKAKLAKAEMINKKWFESVTGLVGDEYTLLTKNLRGKPLDVIKDFDEK